MAVTRGLGTTGDGAGTVTPLDHKLAQSGLLTKSGAGSNVIRSGVFYDGVSNLVVGTAGMSYNVVPFTAALSRGGDEGTVLLCNDGTVNVATTAAPGSNSRIDVVYVWQREFSLDGVDSNPVIGVVQGTAAVSPVAPSLAAFPGAVELARVTVAAGATATNGVGVTITQTSGFTAVAGGVVVFRNATERDAATVPVGTQGYVLSTGERAVRMASGWGQSGYGLVQTVVFTSSGNFTKATYPWLRAARVVCIGGGGAGAGSSNTSAGGGAGGTYAETFITDIAGLPSPVVVTVGAGAVAPAANVAGGAGVNTSFGALCVAPGGGGGTVAGAGGGSTVAGAVGDIIIGGSDGGAGGSTGVPAGYGGASGRAYGGTTRGDRNTLISGGDAGLLYGGGGSGGRGTSEVGGAGAAGIVVIELFA